MISRVCLLCFASIFFHSLCFALSIIDNASLTLNMDTYFRTDLVGFKNVVDLDSANKDDSTTYLGIDYSLGFNAQFKDADTQCYLKLERNGPYDYSAPLFVHNTLMTSGGAIEKYRNTELLPQLEEFWVDAALPKDFRFKIGLYAYEVGNAFSLNGGYENYGFTLSRQWGNALWRFYYCRPEIAYKNHLGPRIRQDEEQGIRYNHNASNFFSTDIKFNRENVSIQPYIGALVDYTSQGKRDNLFSAPVERDILGTGGIAWNGHKDNLSITLEMAHNFGQAKSTDPNYKDVYHTGYLFFSDVDYRMGKFKPSFEFLLCSGNKVTPEMAQNQDATLTSGKNRAFSYYSPLNINHLDSISSNNSAARPLVAMGSGNGLNYGVPRPGTFGSTDFDNLIMPSLLLDFTPTDKLSLGLSFYYLMSFARGVGTLNGEGKYLSRELGYELDFILDYQLNPKTLISICAGRFLPGRYYKEERDDASGSLFSPFLRGDGKADSAYQFEISVEINF